MITFDRQAGLLLNFNRSHVMVIGRSVSFSDPARPPGGGVGRHKHPQNPPPPPKKNNLFAFISEPQEFIFLNHPPPPPHLFFCVLRLQEDVFAKKINSVTEHLTHSCVGMPQCLQALSSS